MCANSKRTIAPHNISQNNTSHRAPKCLKNSDESDPGDNGDGPVDFLQGVDSDTTNAATIFMLLSLRGRGLVMHTNDWPMN